MKKKVIIYTSLLPLVLVTFLAVIFHHYNKVTPHNSVVSNIYNNMKKDCLVSEASNNKYLNNIFHLEFNYPNNYVICEKYPFNDKKDGAEIYIWDKGSFESKESLDGPVAIIYINKALLLNNDLMGLYNQNHSSSSKLYLYDFVVDKKEIQDKNCNNNACKFTIYKFENTEVPILIMSYKNIDNILTETIEKNDPLSYSIIDNLISVSKEETQFDFTSSQLQSSALECGVNNDSDYFDKLVSKFNNTPKIVYTFKYKENSQDDGIFKVTVLPNKPGYTSLDQFKKDFDLCLAGGDAYPKLVNKNWLLFVSSCGSGFDDGSGRVHGCEEIRKIVEPSLKLN
ncbi:MAG TPA: hypothetical protein PL121_01640 [bacterium]|nr:hypothetical protein [bacterium]